MKDKHGFIIIKGARTHNLKNINVSIPRNKLIVITGLSGSGKSSLAFDTIFAEGQRKYVESLSTYARQFLKQLQKPDVDEISGLSPAISISQKGVSNNPRSTVSTITEIYDYLRLLFSRVGVPICSECNKIIQKVNKDELLEVIKNKIQKEKWLSKSKNIAGVSYDDRKLIIMSPVVVGRKGEHYQLLYDLLHYGYEKVRINGQIYNLRDKIDLKKNQKVNIDAIVDTLFISEFSKNPKIFMERLSDSIEKSLNDTSGLVKLCYPDKSEEIISSKNTCAGCGFSFPEIEPRLFSFNSPYGACDECKGLGRVDSLSFSNCPKCNGARLRQEALNVFIFTKDSQLNIVDIIALSIEEASVFLHKIKLTKQQQEISSVILSEINSRLSFLKNVGLNYLTLDRSANTLSGGESQRIRLASQLGSGLVGALYVLDEPTIGLHQSDNEKLIKTLLALKDLGNTIIVVEHDEDTILASDYLVDIGPRAGVNGGYVVCEGETEKLLLSKTNPSNSLTLDYLKGIKSISIPNTRRSKTTKCLELKNIKTNNLKNISLKIPLGLMVAITGVSGSGKSTLMHNVLFDNLNDILNRRNNIDTIIGSELIARVSLINQAPIGRTPRSTPITYIGGFSIIRDLFSRTEEARYRGWSASNFSFNVSGGRCEKCAGNGSISVDMYFLPTVYVKCDLCNGKRYTKEILEIKYNRKNIYDVLNMSVDEAYEFFKDISLLNKKLLTLKEVGLGYISLGQASTTLSGGEAQRIKIAAELGKPSRKNTVYFLDEPTVGLHYEDINKLISILNRLVDSGSSVILIEHNLDIIKSVDFVIDMGPKSGINGGEVVATGTPEEVAKSKNSITAKYIKRALNP